MRGRAQRRHNFSRSKRRAVTLLHQNGETVNEKSVGILARTRTMCSCDGCRNQRSNDWLSKTQKQSMQERRVNIDNIDELIEFEDCIHELP